MKFGSFLINYVCGDFVDIDVFVVVFVLGYLVGVVVDVFFEELKMVSEIFESVLIGFDSVILMLYIGGLMFEVQVVIGCDVVDKFGCYFFEGVMMQVVNFFEVEFGLIEVGCVCFICVYVNVLGFLIWFNEVVSVVGVNIVVQQLQMFGDVGYVVVDFEGELFEGFFDSICVIEGMVWVWLLRLLFND